MALSAPSPLVSLAAAVLLSMAVASAVCGNPEVVQDGETGRLVPVDDTRALAMVLGEALQDAEGREALASAGVAAAGRFSRIQTFSMVEGALHKAAGEPFSGPFEE